MIQEVLFLHSKLSTDESLRIILLRDGFEVQCDKTDLIGSFNDCIRIVRKDGKITSINPDAIAMICTMKRRAYL
jgi:hypothetical protein